MSIPVEIETHEDRNSEPKLSGDCDVSGPELTPSQLATLRDKNFTQFSPIGGNDNVFKCKRDDEFFAVKIISESNEEEREILINEAAVLKELDHINIVRLLEVMINEHDVFLVYEYLDTTLRAYLKTSPMLVYHTVRREFLYQFLNGVAYLHSHKIPHRDLRPENILVYMRTRVLMKIIADFSATTAFDVPIDSSYSQNIGLLSYRAPELLFDPTNYANANDVWSVGCIFAEMHLGRPLFSAGSDTELLNEMFTLLGTPTEEIWPGVNFFSGSIAAFDPPKQPKELRSIFPELEPAGVDILSKMLCLYPDKRISAEDAVKHQYFKGMPKKKV